MLGTTLLAVAGCGKTPTANPVAPPAEVSDALTAAIRSGLPGTQAVITDSAGQHTVTAGAGDLATGAPYPEGAHIRIGSVTKAFVSTVVLQLVAEGAVDLDAPIDRYLPGVVQGNGNDGSRITVHELLQHTSGLPDFAPEDVTHKLPQQLDQTSDGKAYRDFTPADLVRIAMTMPPQFEPGSEFRYTNTNYVLLDMLIEHVTGHTLAAEISSRILDRLAMRDTYFPLPGDTTLRDPHPLGYRKVDGNWVDVTGMDAAWAGAAGAMISTGADLNTFFTALLSGKLLPPAQLTQMKQTRPMSPEMNYGLGLIRFQMPCGKESKDLWGHAGGIPGFSTVSFITPKGAAVTLSVNSEDPNPAFSDAIIAISCAID
ncbi:serine hydrolase domain-containing protein [Nocardia sp. NPDC020380]|uniref:serine hydrolase domain-containing protein n=1 Tax=Nocardia sp. NPDC020380 TaxID=3364309 RepID=UPI00378B0E82